MARATMAYGTPAAYSSLVAPRYAPIAAALLARASLASGESVLEVGAGTGLLSTAAASAVEPAGVIVTTDLSRGMLSVARDRLGTAPGRICLVLDYLAPWPFLDATFDVVMSNLTYVQNSVAALREAARVLRPGGRVAIAMWGRYYDEVRRMSAARKTLGLPRLPSAAPGRAERHLRCAGFLGVQSEEIDLETRFDTVADYLTYRRAFGTPVGTSGREHERYLNVLGRHAADDADDGGALTIGWRITILTGVTGAGH
jgi:SAM-dependent methyltransferase